MPTYLTPGVYVEEVPSANKPIEGVGTVGRRVRGPRPRRSGQHADADLELDPVLEDLRRSGQPGQRPVHGGRLPGALRLRVLPERRQPVLDRPRRRRDGGGRAPQAALPAAADGSVEAFRAVALDGVDGHGRASSSPRSRTPARASDADLQARRHAPARTREEYEGLTAQEGPHEHRHQGQRRLEADQDRGHRRVAARGAGVPATGKYTLSAPSPEPSDKSSRPTSRATWPSASGMGGLAAIDEVTMVVHARPHGARGDGDDTQVRDLQGKMIAHCENAGDRMAILDPPPDLLPQEILEWRMNTAGYDSKMAALYYPWIEVDGPADQPADHDPAVRPRRRAVVPRRRAAAASTRRRRTRSSWAPTGSAFQITQAEQGGLNKVGINCIRAFPGRGIRIWGARTLSSDPEWRYINVRRLFNYVSESIMEGTQWSVFEPNDELLWMQLRIAASNFLTRTWRAGRAVRHLAGRGVLRQVRRGDQPARRDRGRPGRLRDRHRAGEAGRVRDLPPEPVHRRRRRRSRRVTRELDQRTEENAWHG